MKETQENMYQAKMYADKDNWPANFPKPYSDEAGEFMCAAVAASKEK